MGEKFFGIEWHNRTSITLKLDSADKQKWLEAELVFQIVIDGSKKAIYIFHFDRSMVFFVHREYWKSTKWHQSCQVVAQIDTTLLYPNHLPNEFKIYEISNLIYGFLNRIFWTLPILMYHHDWCLYEKNYIHSLSLTESDIFLSSYFSFLLASWSLKTFHPVSQKQPNWRFIFSVFFCQRKVGVKWEKIQ